MTISSIIAYTFYIVIPIYINPEKLTLLKQTEVNDCYKLVMDAHFFK